MIFSTNGAKSGIEYFGYVIFAYGTYIHLSKYVYLQLFPACFENESFEAKETTSSKLRNKLEEAKRVFDPAAKKALDFNLKRTDKFDREKNEDVKEPQKSTNRIKKKPWPLPSGTTPYMKKDRITFKQSGEKEKCQQGDKI